MTPFYLYQLGQYLASTYFWITTPAALILTLYVMKKIDQKENSR